MHGSGRSCRSHWRSADRLSRQRRKPGAASSSIPPPSTPTGRCCTRSASGPSPSRQRRSGRRSWPSLVGIRGSSWDWRGRMERRAAARRPTLCTPSWALGARSEYVQPAALAVAAAGAGRRADVIRHLGEAEATRDPLLSLMVSHWPGFSRELRSDPEFVAVLRRIGWDRPME